MTFKGIDMRGKEQHPLGAAGIKPPGLEKSKGNTSQSKTPSDPQGTKTLVHKPEKRPSELKIISQNKDRPSQ